MASRRNRAIVEARQPASQVVPGLKTEENIGFALQEARGDLFIASTRLQIPPWELDRLIRRSESMQLLATAIVTVQENPEFSKWSAEQFSAELNRLTAQFALDGLRVIHELAMAPASTPGEKQVKLEAATRLRNGVAHSGTTGSMDALLHELNQEYQRAAPRIKEIRTTTVVLEAPKASIPVVELTSGRSA